MSLNLFYITNNPSIALIAEKCGVNRIWIDLESLGKEERQKGMNTVKSHHSIKDIINIKPLLTKSEMLVRINPWNEKSKEEIDSVVKAGADIIMLPMWKTIDEVRNFIEAIKGRVKSMLLLETKEAVSILDNVLEIDGINEIHIGLNDLHLSYNLTFMFELLSNGIVEEITCKIKEKNIPFGIGGISHLGDGLIPAEMLIMEHYRLGSSSAILSRGFCPLQSDMYAFEKEFMLKMNELRCFEKNISNLDIENNYIQIRKRIHQVVEALRNE